MTDASTAQCAHSDASTVPGDPPPQRRRNAAQTRQRLLDAARHRFATQGYAATTIRDITDDAGVNVALVNRYFASKEGLFAACLTSVGDELRRSTGGAALHEVPASIARQVASTGGDGLPNGLMLLLRSSGDERADQIRFGVLRSFAEGLAGAAGSRPGDPGRDDLLLRAEVVLAAGLGIAALRSTTALEPLCSAGEPDLVAPLHDLVHALLTPTDSGTTEGGECRAHR